MRFHRRRIAIPTLTLASVLAFAPAALAQPLDDQSGGNSDGTAQSTQSHRDDYAWDAENDHWHYMDRSDQSNSAVQSRSDQSNDSTQSRSHDDSFSDEQGDNSSTADHRSDDPDRGED